MGVFSEVGKVFDGAIDGAKETVQKFVSDKRYTVNINGTIYKDVTLDEIGSFCIDTGLVKVIKE